MADPESTASRLAGIGRPRAIAFAVLLSLAIIASVWGTAATRSSTVAHSPAQAGGQSRANEDLLLYDRIAMRVATGENYYRAAAEELRDGNYPLKPFVAFRLPTLTVVAAAISRPALLLAQYLLFAAMIAAWWFRLDGQFADKGRRVSAVMLAAAGSRSPFRGNMSCFTSCGRER